MRLYNPLNWIVAGIGFAIVCFGAFLNSHYVMILGGLVILLLSLTFPEPEDKDNFIGRVMTGFRIWALRPKSIWTGLERIFAGSVMGLSVWGIWQHDFNAALCGAVVLICGAALWMHAMETLCLSQPWYQPKTHSSLGKSK